MILKCKICGGDIEVVNGSTIGTCMYCGSTMTLPRLDSDKKTRLFNRAHQYRLNCEFDKAYSAYETIANEDEQEAEAYWGMLLSEYGIEYVEDPATGKRVPTCHRTRNELATDCTNYKLARKNADAESRMMYEDEAEEIDRLQKRILSVSQKQDPYDVFICYKETEENTRERTQDSVLAQDIYEQLTSRGLRVFLSRVTLADKLGTDYEPYIYSALTSSRVMLVVTMNPEHCEAIWVRNEWTRFLKMMEEDINKVLIPVYKDTDPHMLPKALSKYQAQDMGKVGAIQELVASVKKLVEREVVEKKDSLLNELIAEKEKRDSNKQKRKKRLKKVRIGAAGLIAACLVIFLAVNIGTYINQKYIQPRKTYKEAVALMDAGEYQSAGNLFATIDFYQDSEEKLYNLALLLIDEEKYIEARNLLRKMSNPDYSGAKELVEKCNILIPVQEERNRIEAIKKAEVTDVIKVLPLSRTFLI